MELCVRSFEELTKEELYEILKLRTDVFVVEQQCPYPELDGRDQGAWHVFLRDEEGIRAYLRVMDKGVMLPEVSIGRVLSVERRKGLASRLLQEGIRVAEEKFGAEVIALEAQTYAASLYEKQGFRICGKEFLEDGIPHVLMRREQR